jgi:hypothetical protein
LVIERFGKVAITRASLLSIPQILAWADAFRARTGRWPRVTSGPVAEAPGEKWRNIDVDLSKGLRGLPGGSSLSRVLARERGVYRGRDHCPLTIPEILRWADAFHQRRGRWPTQKSGRIREAAGDDWWKVNNALEKGKRGLPGGMSLAQLLEQERGASNHCHRREPLTAPGILSWVDAHRARTGQWPTCLSGPIAEAPGEVWSSINIALGAGRRGLPGGSSLARLLAENGRKRYWSRASDLTTA